MKSRTETNAYRLSGWRRVLGSWWGITIALVAVLVPLAIYAAETGSVDSDEDGFLEFENGTVIDAGEINANFDVVADHIQTYEDAITVDEETGNVGIGTASPGTKLDVYAGTMRVYNNDHIPTQDDYTVRIQGWDNAGGIKVNTVSGIANNIAGYFSAEQPNAAGSELLTNPGFSASRRDRPLVRCVEKCEHALSSSGS